MYFPSFQVVPAPFSVVPAERVEYEYPAARSGSMVHVNPIERKVPILRLFVTVERREAQR